MGKVALVYSQLNLYTIMMDQGMQSDKKVCDCHHHKIIPLLVILIGLTFLLGGLGILTWRGVDIIWPILLIIGGFAKLAGRKCNCC
jgi:hypothetical protein